MARFLSTDKGYVNIDLILRIHEGEVEGHLLELIDGKCLPCTIFGEELAELTGLVIPAAAGITAIVFATTGSERPTAADLWEGIELIIGWRGDSGYPGGFMRPIFRERLGIDARAYLQIGQQYYELEYQGLSFPDLKTVREHFLRWAQNEFDSKHP